MKGGEKMKKAIISLFVASIFIITLLVAPIGINADVVGTSDSISFIPPLAGTTKHWTNPTGYDVNKVTIFYERADNPAINFLLTYNEDGSNSAASVSGIGTPDIKVIIDSTGIDYWRVTITFYSNKWVRDSVMKCRHVWINEDNNFQFVFWYPYKDKNWVRIYDMEDNMVYEVDMPVHDPNLIVGLPDGMYTVKTYHDQELLQEFVIGKP